MLDSRGFSQRVRSSGHSAPPSARRRFSGSRGFSLVSRGFSPGAIQAARQSRRRCAAVSGFTGILPGFHSMGLSGGRRAGAFLGRRISRGCTSDSRGFISESRGFSLTSTRAPFQRPFRPPSVRGGFRFTGLHIGFTWILIGFPGILPGLHSSGLTGRRRCAAVSGSRGLSPGFIPAAIQAAGERAIDRRIHGDSPGAPFPRPFRPPSVCGGFGFPGILIGFPGILPGLRSAAFQAAVGARRCRVLGVASRIPAAPPIPGVSPRIPGASPRALFPRPFRLPEGSGGASSSRDGRCGAWRRCRGGPCLG